MAISYGLKMTWEEFWDSQQNNPWCELFFKYNGKIYVLQQDSFYNNKRNPVWFIAVSENDSTVLSCDESDAILGKVFEELADRYDYDSDDKWKDSMDTCFKLLNMPLFDGRSFREIIEDIDFEY